MWDKIKTWHLSILVVIVSVLSVFIAQQYVFAQWNDPIGLPGETGGFRLVVNPLAEELSLNGHSLSDTDFVINPTGNIGFGTDSPAYKLDVVGDINATEICIDGDCETSWPGSQWENVTNGIRYMDGYVGIGSSPHAGYRVSIADPGVTGTLKLDPGLIWAYQDDLRIDSDYDTFLTGNVRIGSPANDPARTLHVANNADTFARIDSANKLNTAQIEFSRGGDWNTDYSWVGPTSDDTFDVWTMENIPILFGIAGGERARIEPNGDFKVDGFVRPGSYNAMPTCDVDSYGAIGWGNDCGSGSGCLQVCTEVGWKDIVVN